MPHNRTLRQRIAAQSAMSAVVRAQSAAPRHGLVGRVFGVNPLAPAIRATYRDALAERFVGQVLDGLGPRWDTLHDLPLDGSVLDHLVIGPAGVFAVRTATCSGQDVTVDGDSFLVGGVSHDDIRAARADAAEAALLLGVVVRAVLVVVDPRRFALRAPTSDVLVVVADDLGGMLGEAPQALSGDEVARISDLADLSDTWPGAQSDPLDTQQLHTDFAVIRGEVRVALGRRILWAAAVSGLVFGVVWGIIASLVMVVITA